MKITVAIMSYKYGHLVAQAIESVLWQTKKPDEIVVIDDASGDMTQAVAKKYGVKSVVRRDRLGIVDNFNKALNDVETERVMFLGADNWLHPKAIKMMSDYPQDIVSCDAYIVGEGLYKRWTLHYQPHGSALYNVTKAKKVGGYEDSGRKHTEEDSMLFNKMMDTGATFARVDKPLLYYRKHKFNYNK